MNYEAISTNFQNFLILGFSTKRKERKKFLEENILSQERITEPYFAENVYDLAELFKNQENTPQLIKKTLIKRENIKFIFRHELLYENLIDIMFEALNFILVSKFDIYFMVANFNYLFYILATMEKLYL